MGFFWANYVLFELKKYRGLIFHDTEEWCKIWRGIDLLFQNLHEEFGNTHEKINRCLTSTNWCLTDIFKI